MTCARPAEDGEARGGSLPRPDAAVRSPFVALGNTTNKKSLNDVKSLVDDWSFRENASKME